MKHEKVWFEIYLISKAGKELLLARIRSKGLAFATFQKFKEIYTNSQDQLELR